MKEEFESIQSHTDDGSSSPPSPSLSSSPRPTRSMSATSKSNSILPFTQCVSVPKILAYMCDYLLAHGCNVLNLFSRNIDEQRYAGLPHKSYIVIIIMLIYLRFSEVRAKFMRGHYYDCGSVPLVASLLLHFFHALPDPLVSSPFQYAAHQVFINYFNAASKSLFSIPHFAQFANVLVSEDVWRSLYAHSKNHLPDTYEGEE